MGIKFGKVTNHEGRFLFSCPGCECSHFVDTNPNEKPYWTFNGNLEKPTTQPSMLIRGTQPITDDEHERIMGGEKFEPTQTVCHFFITDGFFEYCGDSTHKFSGQKIEVPDWESE